MSEDESRFQWLPDDDENTKSIEETKNQGTGDPYELIIPKGTDQPSSGDNHRLITLLDSEGYDVQKEYSSEHIVVYTIKPTPEQD